MTKVSDEVLRLMTKLERMKSGVEMNNEVLKNAWRESFTTTNTFLDRIGISTELLNKKLSVVHVAGSKGKGSTCAFCESILRHHGHKTGFLSSPHLVYLQERIRIDGRPISTPKFNKYSLHILNQLESSKTDEIGLPTFFQFMTILAFYVFLEEKVDVAILEVGLGGIHDATNVLSDVPVVGITPLQLEHTHILGNTLAEIAWTKAGIMKPGCVALTVADQAPEALRVLKEKAAECNCPLLEVSPISECRSRDNLDISLGIPGSIQEMNASLAVQLSKAWLNRNSLDYRSQLKKGILDLSIDETTAAGLQNCQWPGRNQIVRKNNMVYYLDGAHTPDSIALCADWFLNSLKLGSNKKHKRVLIFNSIGERDISDLLSPLLPCHFDVVLFCPNISYSDPEAQPGSMKYLWESVNQMMDRCNEHNDVWSQLTNAVKNTPHIVKVVSSVSDSFEYIEKYTNSIGSDSLPCHVVVTGSLHLIGNVINVLDPELIS